MVLSGTVVWFFKQGNDTTWAKTDVDITFWQKLKPKDIKASFADKNGRIEGWFRTKIQFDSSLNDMPLYIS